MNEPETDFQMTPDERRFLPDDGPTLHPEAGKPLACSSPFREVIRGRETRVHDGFYKAIPPSTYPEHRPIPESIHE